MTIKAIQTQYKGYNFRSRLEARWAVFFDALGIAWEYEPEGFELPDGSRYLPDFFLAWPEGRDRGWPEAGYWIEIKPLAIPSAVEVSKCTDLAQASGHSVILLSGDPGNCVTRFYSRQGYPPSCDLQRLDHSWWEAGFTGALTWHRWQTNECLVLAAIRAARSARFEFGQTGATA